MLAHRTLAQMSWPLTTLSRMRLPRMTLPPGLAVSSLWWSLAAGSSDGVGSGAGRSGVVPAADALSVERRLGTLRVLGVGAGVVPSAETSSVERRAGVFRVLGVGAGVVPSAAAGALSGHTSGRCPSGWCGSRRGGSIPPRLCPSRAARVWFASVRWAQGRCSLVRSCPLHLALMWPERACLAPVRL